MTFEELYEIAKKTLGVRKTSRNTEVGNVACALETIDGNVYTGINIDTACSMGFCAEANAIGSMLTNGESKIAKLIAVSLKHDIVPPCGRCREFMVQVNVDNLNTEIKLSDKIYTLKELLPNRWEY